MTTENPVAKDFYSSFGFQEVGLDEDGEDMLAVIKLWALTIASTTRLRRMTRNKLLPFMAGG